MEDHDIEALQTKRYANLSSRADIIKKTKFYFSSQLQKASNSGHDKKQSAKIQSIFNQKDINEFEQTQKKNTQKCSLVSMLLFLVYKARQIRTTKIYHHCYLIMSIIYCVSLTLRTPDPEYELTKISSIIESLAQYVFLVFVILRLISLENIHLGWCTCECLAIITGTASLFVEDQTASQYLKAARCMRILLFVRIIPEFYEPFSQFVNGFRNVHRIVIPALCLIYLYALIALFAFSGNQFKRCRNPQNTNLTSNWTYQPDLQYLCGIRQCPIKNGVQLVCLNPLSYGVQPNPEQLNVLGMGYGLLNYKNIFYSIFNTMKMILLTGWSRTAILMKQSIFEEFTILYYFTFLYFVSYIYMNIFYGILMSNQQQNKVIQKLSYIDLNNDSKITFLQDEKSLNSEKSIQSNKSKLEKQKIFRNNVKNLPEKYLKNILLAVYVEKKQNDMQITKKQLIEVEEFNTSKHQELPKKNKKKNYNPVKILFNDYYLPKSQKRKRQLQQAFQIYHYFNYIMIILSCINLCFYDVNQPANVTKILEGLDLIFLCQFTLHILGKTTIHIIKQIKLEEWSRENQVPLRQDLNQTTICEKAETFIFILSAAGILRQAIQAQSFDNFLAPTLLSAKILRSLKYLRIIFVLMGQNLSMDIKIILKCSNRFVKKIIPYLGFYILIITIFSLIGFSLFSENTTQHKQISFNGVAESFYFVLMVFYNEQWDYIMFQMYPDKGIPIVIFQIICVIIGAMILSKYFMAIIMNQFCSQLQKEQKMITLNSETLQNGLNQVCPLQNTDNKIKQLAFSKIHQIKLIEQKQRQLLNQQNKQIEQQKQETVKQNSRKGTLKCSVQASLDDRINNLNHPVEYLKSNQSQQSNFVAILKMCGDKMRTIFLSKAFIIFYIIVVFLDIVEMASRTPTADRQTDQFILWGYFEKCSTIVVLLQIILSLGLFRAFETSESYFRIYKSNYFNFIFTFFCLFSFLGPQNQVLYKMRKLKILRIILVIEAICKKNKKIRLSIICYTKLVPKLIKFLSLVLIIYAFFGIILMKIYGGGFKYCSNYASNAQILTKFDCLNWGGDWVNLPMNTDNILNALIYIIMVASTEGWSTLMFQMANLAGKDMQPVININANSRIFFILFFFFGNMIILNIFIGLSIYTIKKIAKKQTGEEKLSQFQEQWFSVRQKINRIKLYKRLVFPENSFRNFCYVRLKTTSYKVIRFITIFAFIIILSCKNNQIQLMSQDNIVKITYLFIFISIGNFVVMIAGKDRPQNYIKIVLTILFFIYAFLLGLLYYGSLMEITKEQFTILSTIMICIQLFRYWQYLYQVEYVQKILYFLSIILPRTITTLIPMFTVYIIYIFVGMELFAYLKPNTELNQFDQNYRSFFKAFFALTKFSSWQAPIDQIANAAQQLSPNFICYQINSYSQFLQHGYNGCGNKVKSYLFFISFHIIYSMILLTSLTGNVFQSYCQVQKQEQISKYEMQLSKVKEEWLNFDTEGSGFLEYHNFWRFISRLDKIYGISMKKNGSHESKSQFLKELNSPMYLVNKKLCFQFTETLQNIAFVLLSKKFKCSNAREEANEAYRTMNQLEPITMYQRTAFTSEHVFSIIILKSALRTWWKSSVKGINFQFIQSITKAKHLVVKYD